MIQVLRIKINFEYLLQNFKKVEIQMEYKADETALVLIGFQNDYFSSNGALHSVIMATIEKNNILANTVELISQCLTLGVTVYNIPIYFSDNYCELNEPVGLLATLKEVGAFKKSAIGGQVVPEILEFGDKVIEVDGKTSFNAFSKTKLQENINLKNIKNVIFAGVVTSICIDSSARAAFELGYNCIIASDCIAGRSNIEDAFYSNEIFPLYSVVINSKLLIDNIK